jgi:hypothetical protein
MNTMLNIGDFVRHLSTGDFGQVVAYGHEILDSVYHPTLKVEVVGNAQLQQTHRKMFVEDISTAWVLAENQNASN